MSALHAIDMAQVIDNVVGATVMGMTMESDDMVLRLESKNAPIVVLRVTLDKDSVIVVNAVHDDEEPYTGINLGMVAQSVLAQEETSTDTPAEVCHWVSGGETALCGAHVPRSEGGCCSPDEDVDDWCGRKQCDTCNVRAKLQGRMPRV